MADSEQVDYFWFQQRSAVELAFRILRAVSHGTFERLDVIPYEKDGLPALRFRVAYDGVANAGRIPPEADINESFPCPPICPRGGG